MKPSQEIMKVLSSSTPVIQPKPITQQEINKRLNLILSDD